MNVLTRTCRGVAVNKSQKEQVTDERVQCTIKAKLSRTGLPRDKKSDVSMTLAIDTARYNFYDELDCAFLLTAIELKKVTKFPIVAANRVLKVRRNRG